MNHDAQALNRRHFEIKIFLCVVSTIPFDNTHNMRHFVLLESMAMRLLWEYSSTDCTVHDCFAKAVFSENSLCMLEFSILIKCCTTSLDTIQTI